MTKNYFIIKTMEIKYTIKPIQIPSVSANGTFRVNENLTEDYSVIGTIKETDPNISYSIVYSLEGRRYRSQVEPRVMEVVKKMHEDIKLKISRGELIPHGSYFLKAQTPENIKRKEAERQEKKKQEEKKEKEWKEEFIRKYKSTPYLIIKRSSKFQHKRSVEYCITYKLYNVNEGGEPIQTKVKNWFVKGVYRSQGEIMGYDFEDITTYTDLEEAIDDFNSIK